MTYRVFLSKILQTVYLIYTQQGEKPSSILISWSVRLPENLRKYFSSFSFVFHFVEFFSKFMWKRFQLFKSYVFICDTFLHTIWKRMIFLSVTLHSSSGSRANFKTVRYDILYSQSLLVLLIRSASFWQYRNYETRQFKID